MAHAEGVAIHPAEASAPRRRCAAAYPGLCQVTSCRTRGHVVTKLFGRDQPTPRWWCHPQAGADPARRTARPTCDRSAAPQQTERVRKMLLAFSRDLRVVHAAPGLAAADPALVCGQQARMPGALAEESMQVFAPLANRLGIWQIKVGIEDLVPLPQPDAVPPGGPPAGRAARRARGASRPSRRVPAEFLAALGIRAEVQGSPSTSTASGRRCAARAGFAACSTSAPCA